MPLARPLRLALLAVLACALLPATASAATFTKRFSQNDSGDITIAANSLLTCPPGATNTSAITCEAAKSSTSGAAGLADNDFDMKYIDVDGDASTFDSSSARLVLPPGATVLFAGLYWGARTDAGSGGTGQAAPNAAAASTVKLKAPGGSYTTYTADQGWTISADTAYQQFKNVTAAVKGAGAGVYTVADVQAGTGPDRYAGWSLVVAYEDLNAAPHNLSVFDGLTVVSQGTPTADIDVSGFTTAPSGEVHTTLGAIAYEGDMGKTGDGMKLGTNAISDATNPATDLFNSSIGVLGTRTLTGDPAQNNNLGFDADLFRADGYLANNATTARLTVNTAATNGETILPGVLTFSSELLAAKLVPATTVTDENGGDAEPDDVIDVATDATNTGNGAATVTKVESDIPAGLEIVPGSLQVVDADGNPVGSPDAVSWNPATRAITWNVGTGASSSTGGRIAVGERVRLRYRLRVAAPSDGASLAIGTVISYGTEGTSDHYVVTGTGGGSLTASTPDLAMAVSRTGEVVRGGAMEYTLKVSNGGSAAAHGLTRITDQLPGGLAGAGAPSGDGWDCSVAGDVVTCDRTDALASDATFPAVTVPVKVAQSAAGAIANTATVTNAGDGNHANDSATDSTTGAPGARADLTLGLSRDAAAIDPGAEATITATVTNGGPSDATGVQVSLPLPGGVTLVSAQAGGQDCVATICTIPSVAAGGSATATFVVRAARAAAGTTQAFTAAETSAVADGTADDDAASLDVDVREQRDVSLSQTVAPDPLVAGDAVTVTLGVGNDGPSTATGVVLTEPLPAQLRGVTVEADPAAASCAVTAGTLRCDLAPLADGARADMTVHARVASNATGAALDFSASIAPVDRDVDTADDAVTAHAAVAGAADLALTSVQAPATLRAGERGTWVLRATDGGPGDATGATLAFPLPAGLRLVSADGAACTTVAGAVSCAVGGLESGQHRDVTLVLAADSGAAAGDLALAPVLTAAEPDPDAADARVDLPFALTRAADLRVTQSGAAEVVAGAAATFSASVTNAGPSDATHVVVTETVPASLTAASATVAGDGSCAAPSGTTITCRIPRLAVGERRAIALAGTVAPGAGGQALVATTRAGASEPDANAADNEASHRAPAATVSDVSVSALAPAGTIAAGTQAQVTLRVRNDGPSDSTGVVLTQTLPAAAQPVDLDPRCTVSGQVVTCTFGSLVVGAEQPIVIRVRAIRAFDGALLGTGASVAADGRDPQPANDSLGTAAAEPIRCTSRRRFTIHLRVPPAARLTSVSVRVAGKPVRVRVGRRLTAVVDLRTRPAGRILVRIRAVTRGGRHIVGTRAYQTCTVKRPTIRPPRV